MRKSLKKRNLRKRSNPVIMPTKKSYPALKILIPSGKIEARIAQIAKQINKNYSGKELVIIGILKGSFIFMSDLVRALSFPLTCDFLRVSSYEKDRSTGVVRLEFDVTQPIQGKDVLLVEDIVDTGSTLRHLIKHLKDKNPNSLKVATLLYKETGNDGRKLVDYIAFEVPNRFVIGYGLDSEGIYRSLPYVGAFPKTGA